MSTPGTKLDLLKALFRTFAADARGAVAIMFVVILAPVALAMGMAVDYARYFGASEQLQTAVDAGTLAAAAVKTGNADDREATGRLAFSFNMQEGSSRSYTHDATFKTSNGAVVGEGYVDVPMFFISLAGYTKFKATAKAEVGLTGNTKAEVVLVLDYSGSMEDKLKGTVKYKAMRDAAKKLVDDLSDVGGGKVKFGLVPFSHHVYTTMPKAYVLGTSGSGNWTGCTQDRKYPFNQTADTPTAAAGSKWGQPQAPEHDDDGCSGYVSGKLSTLDLTSDSNAVKTQLDRMRPYAWTHIAVGAEFGYLMLDPAPPYETAVSYDEPGVAKIMVLLTDGEQTEPAFGPGGIRNAAQGEANLEALCRNAKADGITIITVAFDLPDARTRNRLKACSSDPARYSFSATDTSGLSLAFELVKEAVAGEIYLKK